MTSADGAEARLESFLSDLSKVGRFHGIALTGEFRAYLMEPEDYMFDYSSDSHGSIVLGESPRDSNGNS